MADYMQTGTSSTETLVLKVGLLF